MAAGTTNAPSANAGLMVDRDVRDEAGRIFVRGLGNDAMADADRSYLANLVAARAGISQDEAQKRVDNAVADARQKADAARKAASSFSFFSFFSMLIGAFIACAAAALGGRDREKYEALYAA